MSQIDVSQLFIYPTKSMGHIALDRSPVDCFGLHNDRRWMVIDLNGKFITQRKYPRMCLINASVETGVLVFRAQTMPDIRVQDNKCGHQVLVSIWGDQCSAYDCGDHVANWLGEFLGVDCRLVYFPDDEKRLIDQSYAKPEEYTAFSDGFPILLISQASLDDLNSKLTLPVEMTRFRPNLVIKGCDAFAEDEWNRIKVGNLEMRLVKPCSRCVIPNIDTETGEKGAEPVKTLSGYRKRNNKVYFGQNVIVNGTGLIEVGMSVQVLE